MVMMNVISRIKSANSADLLTHLAYRSVFDNLHFLRGDGSPRMPYPMKSILNQGYRLSSVLSSITVRETKFAFRPLELRLPRRTSSQIATIPAEIPSVQLNDGTSIPIVSQSTLGTSDS